MNVLKSLAIGMVAAALVVGCASSESAEKDQSEEATAASSADEEESTGDQTGGGDEGSESPSAEQNSEAGAEDASSESGDGANVSIGGDMRKAGTGELADESITKELDTAEESVRLCYEQQLDLNENASGEVVLNFKIDGSGEVADAEVQVDSVGGALGECVAGVVETLEFPGPEGGPVIVNKTYQFEKAE